MIFRSQEGKARTAYSFLSKKKREQHTPTIVIPKMDATSPLLAQTSWLTRFFSVATWRCLSSQPHLINGSKKLSKHGADAWLGSKDLCGRIAPRPRTALPASLGQRIRARGQARAPLRKQQKRQTGRAARGVENWLLLLSHTPS